MADATSQSRELLIAAYKVGSLELVAGFQGHFCAECALNQEQRPSLVAARCCCLDCSYIVLAAGSFAAIPSGYHIGGGNCGQTELFCSLFLFSIACWPSGYLSVALNETPRCSGVAQDDLNERESEMREDLGEFERDDSMPTGAATATEQSMARFWLVNARFDMAAFLMVGHLTVCCAKLVEPRVLASQAHPSPQRSSTSAICFVTDFGQYCGFGLPSPRCLLPTLSSVPVATDFHTVLWAAFQLEDLGCEAL